MIRYEELKEGMLPQNQIKRGSVRDYPVRSSGLSRDLYSSGYTEDDIIGWFSNKYNIIGWLILKLTTFDKREFGFDSVFRTYNDRHESTNIIKFNLKTGIYAFLDNEAYENGILRFEKPSPYKEIIIEPTKEAFEEFGIV